MAHLQDRRHLIANQTTADQNAGQNAGPHVNKHDLMTHADSELPVRAAHQHSVPVLQQHVHHAAEHVQAGGRGLGPLTRERRLRVHRDRRSAVAINMLAALPLLLGVHCTSNQTGSST